MAIVEIPLFSNIYRNGNGEVLEDRNYELLDGYVADLGETNIRPGAEFVVNLGASVLNRPVTGLFEWRKKNVILASAYNKLFKLSNSGSVFSSSAFSETTLTANNPTKFCQDLSGNYVFIASGGALSYTNNTTLSALSGSGLPTDSVPTAATHVCYLDGYIIANEVGTPYIKWSDVNNPLTWTIGGESLAGYAQAVSNPDDNVAIHVMDKELFVFGQSSVEKWETTDSSTTPLQPVVGGVMSVGCIAPYSPIDILGELYWLSDRKQIIRYSGNTYSPIVTPFDKEISKFTVVEDCKSFAISLNGQMFLLFSFPSEQRTFAYNRARKDSWSEWRYFDEETSSYKQWIGNSYAYSSTTGKHLIGDSFNSDILSFSSDSFQDNGKIIRGQKTTGHLDYGVHSRKRSKKITIRLTRGQVDIGREGKLLIRWRDDNRSWSSYREISLGGLGDREIVKEIISGGIYRTRQYQLVWADPVPLSIGKAYEEIEVLSR